MKPRAGILGLGHWLPERVRTNDAWPAEFVAAHGKRTQAEFTEVRANPSGDAVDKLVARYASEEAADPFLGTIRRRVADDDETVHAAEIAAGRAALEDAGVDGRRVDLVISYATIPDRITPSPATAIAHAIGATGALGIGMEGACASSVIGLDLAAAMIESGRARFVLLTHSHLMTRALPMAHPASPNIGDAATATLVGEVDRGGILATRAVSHGEYYDAVVIARRKGDAPLCHAGGPISVGSYDSEQALRLVRDTVRIGAMTVRETLDRAGLGPRDVDVMTSVQPREWVPRAIAEAAGMDPGIAVDTFKQYAHLGACGPIVNLITARRAGRLKAGARVALYGQGAGFTRAAAIVEWC
ncbi:MAG TPA: 3-oxoacyl-[acyl-carrier-protein] synthase III C-terminal domain-containing protein [Polyangiaceae bacterium]|nr:3-oxoacyl-[acyl-carrier-protein] synthase III C-terminal domain-containing protein [Polyangiaceae bacterium]